MAKKIYLGTSDFATIINNDGLLVDKSLLIKEIIEDPSGTILITRPRRWGKTFSMSMLQCFFSPKVFGLSTSTLFDNLAIAKVDNGKFIKDYQGKWPVIFLSFKDVKEKTFKNCIRNLGILIQELYLEHEYLLESDKLSVYNKERFRQYLMGDYSYNEQDIAKSVKTLSTLLYKHFNQKVYILIDEYCSPLHEAYLDGYIDELSTLIRNIMSNALKDNPALQKGIMTGIFRISKDGILSGLNNLKIYTVLDSKYCESFGFTDADLNYLFHEQNLDKYKDEVKHWYNGYSFGGVINYNPWSILSYLSDNCKFSSDWVSTANNAVILKLLSKFHNTLQPQLVNLMEKGEITTHIDKQISFDAMLHEVSSYWTLLLFSGYLTGIETNSNTVCGMYGCKLWLPNPEISTIFNRYFLDRFSRQLGKQNKSFLDNLINGNVDSLTQQLKEYLGGLHFASNDENSLIEDFYYGLRLGLIASLNKTHKMHSYQHESMPLPSVLLLPLSTNQLDLGIIFNFKSINKNESLEALAEESLLQINLQHYNTELKECQGIKKVLKIGLGLNKGQLKAKWQWEKIPTNVHAS